MDGEQVATWTGIVLTAGVSVTSLLQSRRANRHSDSAVALAQAAEARADRLERQQLERRDISWEWRWIREDSVLSFQNVGTDTAYDVEVVVDAPDGTSRVSGGLSVMAPTERIGVRLDQLVAAAEERVRGVRSAGIIASLGFKARGRIIWRSESGVPGVQAWDEIELRLRG